MWRDHTRGAGPYTLADKAGAGPPPGQEFTYSPLADTACSDDLASSNYCPNRLAMSRPMTSFMISVVPP